MHDEGNLHCNIRPRLPDAGDGGEEAGLRRLGRPFRAWSMGVHRTQGVALG